MGVKGLKDLKSLPEKAEKAVRKAMRLAAKDMAKLQENLIESGHTPTGGTQQQNSASYAKRKKGRPPLERTGFLKNAKNWRVRKRGDSFVLRPPAKRETAVYILEARGYKLVTTELPQDTLQKTEAIIAAELKKAGIL